MIEIGLGVSGSFTERTANYVLCPLIKNALDEQPIPEAVLRDMNSREMLRLVTPPASLVPHLAAARSAIHSPAAGSPRCAPSPAPSAPSARARWARPRRR